MKWDSLRIFVHLNARRIAFSFYIFLNIMIILFKFIGNPIFFFDSQNSTLIFINSLTKKGNIFKNNMANQRNNNTQNEKSIAKSTPFNYSLFPIDLVYTWVDGRDEKWLKEFNEANEERDINISESDFFNRFVDTEELRYSLRSVEKNLPWIRYIFIVVWGNQRPEWINVQNSKIKFISHSEIFPETVKLPTFNSKSIDFLLYKIPELSEHFIYSNDDMYFGQKLEITDFFTIEGKPIIYSKKNNWPGLHKKFIKFEKDYNKSHSDDFLFMISMFYTLVCFEKKFNKIMSYEFSHIPIPLTKTICENVYLNFKNEIDITISNRFRSPHDFQMQTIMIQYGLLKNLSIVKLKNQNDAVFIAASMNNHNFRHLHDLVDNVPKFMSINVDEMKNREFVKAFLDHIFNEMSSFELKNKQPVIVDKLKNYWANKAYINNQR